MVSVILPNYNHEKYIKLRIESILNQNYSDLELIILDDASTDQSVKLIEEYKYDERLKFVITNQTNSGSTFYQWKKGLELAKGEYIWIAESDDEADIRFLSTAMAKFKENPNIGVVYSPSVWIDENSVEIHKPKHEEDDETWNGTKLIQNEFLVGNLIYNASSAVFKKSLIEKVHFDDLVKFKYAGDWMFWVQIIDNTLVTRLDKRYNYFRRHNSNISYKSDQEGLQFTEGIKVSEFILNKYPISFIKRRKTMIFWAKRLLSTKVNNPSKVLAEMPTEMKFWYKILKTLS